MEEAARSAASFMDGCGEAGEAQGILNGFNFVTTSLDLACEGRKGMICSMVGSMFADWIQFSMILFAD